MFKGTPEFDRAKGTAVAAVLEALGARFNATTWFDRTNYYETLPSDALEVAVRIESSRMRRRAAARRGPRARDDRRAQRVRAGRELAVPGPLQAHVRDGVPRAPVPSPDDRLAERHRGGLDGAAARVLRHLLPPEQRDGDGDRRLRRGADASRCSRGTSAPIPRVAAARSRGSTRSSLRRRASAASSCAARARSRGAACRGGPSRRVTPTRRRSPCSATCSAAGSPRACTRRSSRRPWRCPSPSCRGSCAIRRSSRSSRPVRPGVEPVRGRVRHPAGDRAHRGRRRHRGRVREGAHADRGGGHLRPRLDRPDRRVALGGHRRRRLGVVRRLSRRRSARVTPEDVRRVVLAYLARRRADGRALPAEGPRRDRTTRGRGDEEEAA